LVTVACYLPGQAKDLSAPRRVFLYHFRVIFQDTGNHVKVKVKIKIKIKIKQSHYRPEQTLWVPGSWGCQISYEGVKVDSPMHRPPLLPGNIPGTHFCWSLSQPQDHRAAGRIISMENSSGNIQNRTRDPPTCSAVSR